jgi:hypothetical protein
MHVASVVVSASASEVPAWKLFASPRHELECGLYIFVLCKENWFENICNIVPRFDHDEPRT